MDYQGLFVLLFVTPKYLVFREELNISFWELVENIWLVGMFENSFGTGIHSFHHVILQ